MYPAKASKVVPFLLNLLTGLIRRKLRKLLLQTALYSPAILQGEDRRSRLRCSSLSRHGDAGTVAAATPSTKVDTRRTDR